jgi:glycosyltransferase involved in cell wall biosynthesis
MIEGQTILCLASGYDAPPTSKHHVMHLLAQRNQVLWVNYHASRAPSATASDLAYMARKAREVLRGVQQVRENFHVLTPPVIPLPSSHWAKRLNRKMLVSSIRGALRGLGDGPLQVWSFTPDVSYLLDALTPRKVIYYCVDDFASFTGYDRRRVQSDEVDLCKRADLVVTTSRALQEAKKSLNSNTIFVPHGVDYEHFAKALCPCAEPVDLSAIPRPRVGFFGLIRDWLDLDLVRQVAAKRPAWQFVFIGGHDWSVDLSLYRMPNIHFIGGRPYGDLPAYCAHMDVGLIPFKLNELTMSVNPIKLREYLAAGLPVAATPLPEVQAYSELVRIGAGPTDFTAAIEAALQTPPEARRRLSEAMAAETWPTKMEQICRCLQDDSPQQVDNTVAMARSDVATA